MRNFLAPSSPFAPSDNGDTTSASFAFFYAIKELIEKGIYEGIFESTLNPEFLTRTILTLFASIIGAATQPAPSCKQKNNYITEIKNIFDILLRGMAKPEIDRALLSLPGAGKHHG
jgi:hypothetical protein